MAKRITKGNLWGFIQSRPYASVADIRRLFAMDVDGAATVPTSEGTYYIGLPQEAAELVRQLWQEGRIVLDVNPDVKARVVQGLYPIRIAVSRRQGQSAATKPSPVPPGPAAAPEATVVDAIQQPDARRRRRRRRRSPGGTMAAGSAQASGEIAHSVGVATPPAHSLAIAAVSTHQAG